MQDQYECEMNKLYISLCQCNDRRWLKRKGGGGGINKSMLFICKLKHKVKKYRNWILKQMTKILRMR